MSRHRAVPPRGRPEPTGRRRADALHPRYGRIAVLGASVIVTCIAMLGGVGVLPSVAGGGPESDTARDPSGSVRDSEVGSTTPSAQSTTHPSTQPSQGPAAAQGSLQEQRPSATEDDVPPVPTNSGEGRRVVFDENEQRVWLVAEDGEVERTYPVSGSLYDNLDPGTYSVYSRSEDAVGIDDSGTMRYFVRFTQGDNGAAIGFHDIPVDDGKPVQTRAELGTPQSHGCIRQERNDAIALWDFAPIGTQVVVV